MSTTMATAAAVSKSFDTFHEDVIHDIQSDYFGKRVATASSDRTIRIFDENQHLIGTLAGVHEGPVWAISWSHPKFGSLLASAGYDGRVVVWKDKGTNQWGQLKEFKTGEASVNSVSWAPHEQGLILAAASSDGKIHVFSYDPTGMDWKNKSWLGHAMGVNSVSFAPAVVGGAHIVSGGSDNLVKIWRLESGEEWKQEEQLEGHADWVRDVAWSPNGDLIASGSNDKKVYLWKKGKDKWVNSLLKEEGFGETVWRVSWSVGGSLLAVSTGDNKVTVWRENIDGKWQSINQFDPQSVSNQ